MHGPAPLDLPLRVSLARTFNGISPASLLQAIGDWQVHLATSPAKQAELVESAQQKALRYLQYLMEACQGSCGDCVHPGDEDKRFARPEWHRQPFCAIAQAFLLQQQWWDEATHDVRGVSQHHEEVTSFLVRQLLDTLSPSNFVATNPQVLQETGATFGANLAGGFLNWWRDAVAVLAGGKPRGVEAFRPGETVALTPGKVVMRNHLVELIQYEPATPRVHRQPVLVVPSWIMKYYILDLTPDDSLVRWLVAQGHTVFTLSWRNPGAGDSNLGLDDYLQLGVMESIRKVESLYPGAGIHAAGYCLGGTLLSIAAAQLGSNEQQPLATVSLIAALTDFQEPGELGLFMDESQIAFLEDVMAERGYLDGRQMAGAFQLINSKDLVWSKLVHEYLMGARSPVKPLGAWNADATRMPARMHSEYLRSLYLHNDLAEGRYRVRGTPVSLHDIRVPVFVLATERDHVSPWHSVYKVLRLVDAQGDFVLTSGGHNVCVVNPPAGPLAHAGASYRHAKHGPREAPADPQQWLDAADSLQGSWWTCWQEWLTAHSTGQVARRVVKGIREQGVEVPAPGTYVFQE